MSQELIRRVTRIQYDQKTGEPVSFPTLDSAGALPGWQRRIEADLQDAGIPHTQWSDAAILFLDGPVKMTMRQQRQHRVEKGLDSWPWNDFTAALHDVLIERDARPSTIQRLREDHPVATTVAGAGLFIAGGAVLGPAIVVGGLNAVGFTSGGVAAGSLATGIQSAFYGGATSGLFSVCQSIGATAVAPSLGSVAASLGSVAPSLGSVISGFGSVVAGVGLFGGSPNGGRKMTTTAKTLRNRRAVFLRHHLHRNLSSFDQDLDGRNDRN